MEQITLEKDIQTICLKARSFPEGIHDAHEELHKLIPAPSERRFFGISFPGEDKKINYFAAAEELQNGEAEKLNCRSMNITKGNYISITLKNYFLDIPSVGKAFEELLANPAIDPNGFCLEWYLNEKDVRCMVKVIP